MSSVLESGALLALDVGCINTRLSLFDVVDGRYRLVANARTSSTAGAPLFDVSEGVRLAMDQIQSITGRRLTDEAEMLIMPSTVDGMGIDSFVATTSAGPSVRTVLVGLMPGVSIESANRLAVSSYLEVVDEFNLLDQRREEEQIDLIVSKRPELILVVGGTDGGASDSVLRMVDIVGLAISLLPDGHRPYVVYAGNRHLGATVVERIGERAPVTLVPNIRPSLAEEDLTPARLRLAEVIHEVLSDRVNGLEELKQWSGGYMMLTADAFGRIVRYLSQVYDTEKGVVGLDVGACHTTIAAAFHGDLRVSVRSDLGLGAALPGLLQRNELEKVIRWLPMEVSESRLRDYIYNKALHPGTVPVELEELHVEYALVRQLIRTAFLRSRRSWPPGWNSRSSWLTPPLELILASGGAMSRAPRPGYAALVLLDALQPTGVSSLALDPFNLTPALGAAAGPIPMAAVQVLEAGGYVGLGTVVAPVGHGRPGRPMMHVRLEREGRGQPVEGAIRYGQLAVLPLRQGERGRLTLRPERGFDVGFGGSGRAGALRITGGAVGVIIDARGRPLTLAKDDNRRRESIQRWLWDIGAVE